MGINLSHHRATLCSALYLCINSKWIPWMGGRRRGERVRRVLPFGACWMLRRLNQVESFHTRKNTLSRSHTRFLPRSANKMLKRNRQSFSRICITIRHSRTSVPSSIRSHPRAICRSPRLPNYSVVTDFARVLYVPWAKSRSCGMRSVARYCG